MARAGLASSNNPALHQTQCFADQLGRADEGHRNHGMVDESEHLYRICSAWLRRRQGEPGRWPMPPCLLSVFTMHCRQLPRRSQSAPIEDMLLP